MKKKSKLKGGMKKKLVMRQNMQGAGFLDWIKGAANTVNDALKKSKIISTVAGLAPIPYSGAVSTVARNLGYGKRRNNLIKH
jgi:hypothetical protein